MLLDEYTISDVDKLSDEEVLVLLAAAQREQQILQARKELKKYLDIRNAEESKTIKIDSFKK